MKRLPVVTLLALIVPMLFAGTVVQARQAERSSNANRDAAAACTEMMRSQGMSEEGRKAMGEFMRSERAPQMMARMMEMARKMGNGDVMAGMTRMMDTMGSMGRGGMMGGMMEGQGGMMQPGGRQPTE